MELDKRLRDNAHFYRLYGNLILFQVEIQDEDMLSRGNSWEQENSQKFRLASHLMDLSYRMQNLFLGINSNLKVGFRNLQLEFNLKMELQQFRIIANLVILLDSMSSQREDFQLENSNLLQQLKDRLFLTQG